MITIKHKGAKELKEALALGGQRVRPIGSRALDLASITVRKAARDEITTGTSYKGDLARKMYIQTLGALIRIVGSNLIYAHVIHDGSRGGAQPPSKPLEAWARTKLGKPGLGFVIARKIKQRGGIVRKNAFLDHALRSTQASVERIFEAAYEEIKRIIIKGA